MDISHESSQIVGLHTLMLLRLALNSNLVLLDERNTSTGVMNFFPHFRSDLIDVRAGR